MEIRDLSREAADLDKGDNSVEILLVFIEGHVLKLAASIRQASVVCSKEHRYS